MRNYVIMKHVMTIEWFNRHVADHELKIKDCRWQNHLNGLIFYNKLSALGMQDHNKYGFLNQKQYIHIIVGKKLVHYQL